MFHGFPKKGEVKVRKDYAWVTHNRAWSKRVELDPLESISPDAHVFLNFGLNFCYKEAFKPSSHNGYKNLGKVPYSGETMANFFQKWCSKNSPLKLITFITFEGLMMY